MARSPQLFPPNETPPAGDPPGLSEKPTTPAPLAERMRPRSLDDVVGQDHLAGPRGLLRSLGRGSLPSLLLHGPPGSGKTTLARLYAEGTGACFQQISAVLSGVAELRETIRQAETARRDRGQATVLFVDEIHRWNKAQQDALLPLVESGTLALVGATTENPSFEIIAPLRSRCRVVRLRRLQPADVRVLLDRALRDPDRGLGGRDLGLDDAVLDGIARVADGDARRGLVLLEELTRRLPDGAHLTLEAAADLLERPDLFHDPTGDTHYDVLSAFIKSIRGSDPDAALYWLARLLEAGEPPEAIARRVIIAASEDVGNADPRALEIAVAAAQGVAMVGLPEARLILAQAVAWCAAAPKSDACTVALDEATRRVRETGALPVPMHLRNAPTDLLKAEGAGRGYLNPHDHPGHVVRQAYRPPELEGERWYRPTQLGAEKTLAERLAHWEELLQRRGRA